MDKLAEKLLLCHPKMRNYYLIKYELYKLLNLDFDLFFTEDIYNYNNDFYTVFYRDHCHTEYHTVHWKKPIIFQYINYKNTTIDIEYNAVPYFTYYEASIANIDDELLNDYTINTVINIINDKIPTILLSITSKNVFSEKQINIMNYIRNAIHSKDIPLSEIIQEIKNKL